jgi:tRNA (guanine-N1)-methyltransferase
MVIAMDFHVLTLFPEMIQQGLGTSITGRAMEKGLIKVNTVNIRDFSEDKHYRVDDYPYGGGAGMVMQAEPVFKAYGYLVNHIKLSEEASGTYRKPRVIYVTPQGNVFRQEMAQEFAKEENLVFLCGHYEGIDERVLEMIVTDYVSIGDYVLTGGELPAMVMIDAISRLVPGVLGNEVSSEFESLQDNLLEYPQYTRPETFMGKKVPEVLLTGHHANIEAWRREQSILRTYERRPDLLEKANLTEKEREFLTRLIFQKNYDIYS